MAHKFETGVMYGDKAWHGLGTTLDVSDPRRRDVHGTMTAASLDWQVAKFPLQIASDPMVPEDIRGAGILDRHAVVRLSDHAILGTVGDRYACLQNSEMFAWFQPYLDAKVAEFETAGSLDGGRIVWVLARMAEDDLEVSQGDTIRPYLLLTSSHDGSLATRAGFCPIRVVCWNTLSANLNDARSQLIRVRHTRGQQDALEAVRETMDLVNGQFRATVDQYRRLQSMPIHRDDLRKYVKQVLELPEDENAISTRSRNAMSRIIHLSKYGVGQDGSMNAWAAYQGVTHYLSHERGKDHAKRLQSLWLGDGANVNRRAFELALQIGA